MLCVVATYIVVVLLGLLMLFSFVFTCPFVCVCCFVLYSVVALCWFGLVCVGLLYVCDVCFFIDKKQRLLCVCFIEKKHA